MNHQCFIKLLFNVAKVSASGAKYLLAFFQPILELRQYKNGLASVKNMFVLKLPPFFPHLRGKGKRAAISKLPYVSQKGIRSYIVLALDDVVKKCCQTFCPDSPPLLATTTNPALSIDQSKKCRHGIFLTMAIQSISRRFGPHKGIEFRTTFLVSNLESLEIIGAKEK